MQYNNYFTNITKNLAAYIFMNCEATTLYPHRSLLEAELFTTCFNDYKDLMVAARFGKNGYIPQIAGPNTDEQDTRPRYVSWAIFEISWGTSLERNTEEGTLSRARMQMHRVCVYHVIQDAIGKSQGICGEVLAILSFECVISSRRDRRRREQSLLLCSS